MQFREPAVKQISPKSARASSHIFTPLNEFYHGKAA